MESRWLFAVTVIKAGYLRIIAMIGAVRGENDF
jgi:hypothetical protein